MIGKMRITNIHKSIFFSRLLKISTKAHITNINSRMNAIDNNKSIIISKV